jgi:hypothetical protein
MGFSDRKNIFLIAWIAGSLSLFGCSESSNKPLIEVINTGSAALETNSSLATYDTSLVSISSASSGSLVQLKTLYSSLVNFSDGLDNSWNTLITLPGGSFATGPDFTGGNLSFASQTDWVGVANSTTSQSDYVMLMEFAASVFDGGNTISSCMRMQANNDDHYRFSIASSTADISYRASAAWTSVASAAVSLTPAASTTYFVKTSAVGGDLSLKIWDSSSTEPTTAQVTVTDATYASGYPCLMFQAGITGTVDNIRIGSSSYSTDYSIANPTFVFPAIPQRAGIRSVSATVTSTGSDAVKFDVSLDGGTTYLVWDGTTWVSNSLGYASANTLADVSANIASMPLVSGLVLIRAYLHSETGYSTPSLSGLSIVYK